jgi:hypothetical protein
MEQRSGFVSFGSTQDHLADLIRASAEQRNTTWTVAEGAQDGDLVVFYFTIPVAAFLACGRVIRRSKETWGRDKKPMADVGMIRLFPEPVTLRRAKERLALPWLRTPQGFGTRRQENVALLLALGGARA